MTDMFYFVIEMQTASVGSVLPYAYDNRPDAEAKYHALLSVAAKSSVPYHCVMLVRSDGFVLKSEIYDHTGE